LPCFEAKQHLRAKVEAISQQIEGLETLKGKLPAILNCWQEQPPIDAIDRTIATATSLNCQLSLVISY
jgi:MerR family transcriptional regulator, copper efflux regulator